MSHLDEGTLHAMLDGELEPHDVAEIKAHVAACSSCGLRLREVQEFLDEADRLVSTVHLDAATAAPSRRFESGSAERPEPVRHEPVRHESVRSEPEAVRPRPVPERPVATETWNAPPPPLLMPDNESPADRRMRRVRKYGWAAMILVFVSAGIIGVQMREPAPGFERQVGLSPNAVVSPEETSRDAALTDSAPTELAKAPAPSAPAKAAGPAGREATTQRTPSRRTDLAVRDQAAANQPAAKPETARAESTRADSSATLLAAASESAGPDDSAADTIGSENLVDVRERASEALAELDRERRRNEAAAATAALDSQRRRRQTARSTPSGAVARGAQVAPAAATTPAPAPTPPTLEQRAQIYLRIGLDEAARQLGGPAHVIEGMSAMFTGLAQGVVVAGADATRPVVRVVYQDSQGRLIMLDQQRMRPGQAAPLGSPLGWAIGETAVWLHGEAGPDVLRLYRPRVR
jgi:hypothetical protein